MDYQLIIDDYIGCGYCSKQTVRQTLDKYRGKHVDVKISSFGGDLTHALDIRQQFIDHGDVTAHIIAFSASSATVIATGAKHVCMSKYAVYMAHKCSNYIGVVGRYNADEIQELIDDLYQNKLENDKIDRLLASLYADKSGRPVDELLDVLKAGNWLTAEEALSYGFVDEISEYKGPEEKSNLSNEFFTKLNMLRLPTEGLLRNTPTFSNIGEAKILFDINKPNHQMETTQFKAVESLLKLDNITADKDGYVSVKTEEFKKVNDRLEELEKSDSAMKSDIAKKDARIAELETQVENLNKAPGDDTDDIKDDGSEYPKINASEMYNLIKSSL